MHQTPPDFDTAPATEWFSYFRKTSFVGAMPRKFTMAMDEATDAPTARRIMTAYAACALDISMLIRNDVDESVLAEMERELDFSPSSFLYLNMNDVAALAGRDPAVITAGFRELGFSIGEDGRVNAYTRPAPQSRPQTAAKSPRP